MKQIYKNSLWFFYNFFKQIKSALVLNSNFMSAGDFIVFWMKLTEILALVYVTPEMPLNVWRTALGAYRKKCGGYTLSSILIIMPNQMYVRHAADIVNDKWRSDMFVGSLARFSGVDIFDKISQKFCIYFTNLPQIQKIWMSLVNKFLTHSLVARKCTYKQSGSQS